MNSEDRYEHILEEIKKTREKKKITQKEMAEKLGMTQPNYRNIEGGIIELKVRVMYRIMDILGIEEFGKTKTDYDLTVDSYSIKKILENQEEILSKIQEVDTNTKEIKTLQMAYDRLQTLLNENPKELE